MGKMDLPALVLRERDRRAGLFFPLPVVPSDQLRAEKAVWDSRITNPNRFKNPAYY